MAATRHRGSTEAGYDQAHELALRSDHDRCFAGHGGAVPPHCATAGRADPAQAA